MNFSLTYLLDRLFIKKPRIRRSVTKLLYGSRDVEIDILGNTVLLNTLEESGYFRFARISQRYEFLRSEIRPIIFMASLVDVSTVFLDVGANIGIWSIIMSSLGEIKKRPQVFAFEPDPKTFKRLQVNAKRWGFTAINCALGAQCSLVSMRRGAVSHVTHFSDIESVYTYGLEDQFQTVCARLDCFEWIKNDTSLLMIKVDVEGAESDVIKGAEMTLQRARRCVLFVDGYSSEEVPRTLSRLGYELYDSEWFRRSGRIIAAKGL